MTDTQVDILFVDDSQEDVDLALHALRAEGLANSIFFARDGEEALDFLFCRGAHAERSFDHPPKIVKLALHTHNPGKPGKKTSTSARSNAS